ncbi:hypothetical protein ACQ9AK_10480 [Escherichia coli]|uniref:hypothetical protein n=1 Tax=Escherichia coli TaxID=562 RepID=UPI003D369193
MNKKVTTNVPKVSGIKRIRAFADRDKNFNKMSEAIIRRAENTEVEPPRVSWRVFYL